MKNIYSNKLSELYSPVAAVLIAAMLIWLSGMPFMMGRAGAAQLTNMSDTIETSNPGDLSNHVFQFTMENGMVDGQEFAITMPAGFNVPVAMDADDIDIASSSDITIANNCAGSDHFQFALSGQNLIFSSCPTDFLTIASSTVITIEVGTNATFGITGVEKITNHVTAASYEITAQNSTSILPGSTFPDVGFTRIVMIDDVTVTASVNSVFQFVVSGVVDGQSVNLSPTTTVATTTATEIPFGTLSAGVSLTMAQDLQVTTNAANGFVVTIEHDGDLRSASGADIDGFIDGAYTDTPVAWQGPGGTLGNEFEYGHIGITSEDDINTNEFDGAGGDKWISASTTPRAIFSHNAPTDGIAPDSGTTRIGFQVEISSLQEAGNDYTNTLMYIATPTF